MAGVDKLIAALKGLDSGSPVMQEFAKLAEKKLSNFKIMSSPGDVITRDHVMAAPQAPDLWYIFNHCNMLTWADDTPANSFMAERLPWFMSVLKGIKPLKGIVSVGEVKGKRSWFTDKMHWTNQAKDWVNLIASEIRFTGQKFQYSTEVPMPKNAVGYIMIPIGGQGIMEVISLIQETLTEVSGFDLQFDEKPKTINADEGIRCIDEALNLCPPGKGWIPNACYGRKLIEKTTVIPESEKLKVFIESRYKTTKTDIINEAVGPYPTHTFVAGHLTNAPITLPMEKIYGKGVKQDGTYDKSRPGLSLVSYVPPKVTSSGFIYGGGWIGKHWLRVWIAREDKWPVPGEFIGILVKPCPVPPHVWWFQRSSPLLYAGNWMDTLDLTSGVIITVIPDQIHPVTDTICTQYAVKIHGVDSVKVYSSDFLLYTVGTRVAIWKNRFDEDPIVVEGGHPTNYLTRPDVAYDQMEQQEWGEPIKDTVYGEYYTIFPITFFQ